mmetsp:Transcript_14639/g.20885  ORF Transcript_14639/g.20885 Transcript_14639/m.20885 type:complete len:614 (-) Transcript_14639:293-2134(-)
MAYIFRYIVVLGTVWLQILEGRGENAHDAENGKFECNVYELRGAPLPGYSYSLGETDRSYHCVQGEEEEDGKSHQIVRLQGDVNAFFSSQGHNSRHVSGMFKLSIPKHLINTTHGHVSLDNARGIESRHGVEIISRYNDHEEARSRRLADLSSSPKFLVVRVKDSNGLQPQSTVQDLKEEVFTGTLTMKKQFARCSGGKYTPTEATVSGSVSNFSGGVLEVTVSNLNGVDATTCMSRAINAIPSGISYDMKMIICPQEVDFGSLGAVAYVNGDTSWYMNNFGSFPHFQMHEIGHNLNMAHSNSFYSDGLGNRELKDPTCNMGSEAVDTKDWGNLCYNAPKSYYTGWYPTIEVDPRTENLKESLIGVNDFVDGLRSTEYVVIKIKGSGQVSQFNIGRPAYFLMYHVKEGITGDMVEEHVNDYANKVQLLFQREGKEDGSYQACTSAFCESYFLQNLGAGDTWSFTNWDDNGNDLHVKVCSLNLSGKKNTASVLVYLSDRNNIQCDKVTETCEDANRLKGRFKTKSGKIVEKTCSYFKKPAKANFRCKALNGAKRFCPESCRNYGSKCSSEFKFAFYVPKIQKWKSCSYIGKKAQFRCKWPKVASVCRETCKDFV